MLLFFCLGAFFAFGVSDFFCRRTIRCGIVDDATSEPHKSHIGCMPTGGGSGIFLGTLLPIFLGSLFLFGGEYFPLLKTFCPSQIALHLEGALARQSQLFALIGCASAMYFLGALDDRYKLKWWWRLLVQCGAASVVVFFGWHATGFFPASLQLIPMLLSVLWIVALTNSFNMLDNMNGLSVGVAAIVAAFLATVMFIAPQTTGPQLFLAGILIIFLGALTGFLRHNSPFHARIFMGDGGAYFIGFFLAALSLGGKYTGYDATQHPQTILVPLLIFAVPLYDTCSVIFIRLREGRSPFHGDKHHFSHRLVALGLSPTYAVMTIYLTTAICSFGALLLYQLNLFGGIIVLVQVVMILTLIAIWENTSVE